MSRRATLVKFLYVLGATGLPWRGVDMSQLASEDAGGEAPPFRKFSNSSTTVDALALLRASGANAFRMRMWNDPCGDGRCDPAQYSYANLTGVLLMAKRCQENNLTFILDFHYSDWWADPGKQYKPTAWANLSFDALQDAVYDFSRATVAALVSQGTPPAAVQIGNEISDGLLWNGEGQPCNKGGKLYCSNDATLVRGAPAEAWARVAKLVGAGVRGVRGACPGAAVAIHTDLGNHINGGQGIGYVIDWYQNMTDSLAALDPPQSFDMIGLSMYPKYDKGTTFGSIRALTQLAKNFQEKTVYIAETAYPAAGNETQEKGFAPTPQGQLSFLRDVFGALQTALPAGQYAGALWWEGNEAGGYNSLFDADHVARPALLSGFRGA